MSDERDADQKLRRYAKQVTRNGSTRWYFGNDPSFTHGREQALEIIDACLLLGVPVTDMVSGSTWLRMILRIVSLERRVAALEEAASR
jgi:hypothetical protein